jgi:hypothetical protein
MSNPYEGNSGAKNVPGLKGTNIAGGDGTWGDGRSVPGSGFPDGRGLVGISGTKTGTEGNSTDGVGVFGSSTNTEGVHGISHSLAAAGVTGINDNTTQGGPGVYGYSVGFDGVAGLSHSPNHAGVSGTNDSGGGFAGFFVGNVVVTQDLTVNGDITLSNADCAEDFDIGGAASLVEPGTVMTLGKDGALFPAGRAYDKCVAGVVSGAGDLKPGIVLDKQSSKCTRQPIALLGKTYCKVDALYGSIEIGDLLTTSQTPGHAMKVHDRDKAFGSVIGKALRALPEGRGLIPILIALQ